MSRSSGFEQCHVSKWWDFIYCPATDKQLLSVHPDVNRRDLRTFWAAVAIWTVRASTAAQLELFGRRGGCFRYRPARL